MRGLKMTEETKVEKRLGRIFFLMQAHETPLKRRDMDCGGITDGRGITVC
jgi:hypothetical protein